VPEFLSILFQRTALIFCRSGNYFEYILSIEGASEYTSKETMDVWHQTFEVRKMPNGGRLGNTIHMKRRRFIFFTRYI
jgi:hypothetical protein